ncbi:MAG: FG-GAP repeat domain-containing protein [Planctomycetota bacterium]
MTLHGATTACLVIAAAVALPARAQEQPLVFAQPVYDAFEAPYFPTTLEPLDFDLDGNIDLVVPGRDPDGRLFTMRGLGNGRFTVAQTLVADGFVDCVGVADMDGDAREDIVAMWRGDLPRLVLYRAQASGFFEPVAEVLSPLARDPQGLALADFDGDGDTDIAALAYVGAEAEVFLNGGTGAVTRVSRVQMGRFIGGIAYPRVVRAGDVDGDGDADLVAVEVGGSRIAVMRNDGGRFARAVEYRGPQIGVERPGMSSLVLADIDGDRDLDAVCPALLLEAAQKIVAFVNDGSGRFDERLVGEGPPLGYAFAVEVADFDGDGDADSAVGAALPGLITVGRRTGPAFSFTLDGLLPFGQLVRDLRAIDVDGDCDLDIVGIDGPARAVFTCINNTPQKGCGGGVAGARRAAMPAKPQDRAAEPALRVPARGDFNGDGVRDAADVAVWLAGLAKEIEATASQPSSEAAASVRKEPR